MSDGNISRVVGPVPISTTSSKGIEASNNKPDKVEASSPIQTPKKVDVGELEKTTVQAAEQKKEPVEEKPEATLSEVVSDMNDFVQSVHRDLHFSIDEELDQTVVKVIDGSSGDLIRQIPEESFLDVARTLRESGELQLVNATG